MRGEGSEKRPQLRAPDWELSLSCFQSLGGLFPATPRPPARLSCDTPQQRQPLETFSQGGGKLSSLGPAGEQVCGKGVRCLKTQSLSALAASGPGPLMAQTRLDGCLLLSEQQTSEGRAEQASDELSPIIFTSFIFQECHEPHRAIFWFEDLMSQVYTDL